jgi:hypothetical protein
VELNELVQEREWRLCRGPADATTDEMLDAFTHFCMNYWSIKHPERGRILFEMRHAQRETVRAWLENRYSVVLKARQIGFSTLAAAYAFWLVYFQADRFVIMLSRTEREAMKLLQKSKYGYRWLPNWMRDRGPRLLTDHQLKMVFDNDSAIESLPSSNDPARGESVYLVIVDEMAFLPNPDEAWASIEPIADVGGRVICLSTANGSGNFFHQLWTGSQTGTNLFRGVFWSWDAGDRNQDWYEVKKRTLPEWQLHQEYPRSPDEAFIKSGNPVFDIDIINSLMASDPTVGILFVDGTTNQSAFKEYSDGPLRIWEFPEPDGVYVVGADVAEGLAHGDYSSAHIINAKNGMVAAHWHGRIEPDLFGEMLAELGWMYNSALVGVENNNHGLTTLKALQRYGYKNIYRQRRLAQARPTPTEILGWRTTASSKPLMIDELSAAIRQEELDICCEFTIGELRTFVRKENGKMSGSPHDDRVISLAISNQMLKFVWLPEYYVGENIPRNSLAWWEQFIIQEKPPKNQPIGAYNVRHGAGITR